MTDDRLQELLRGAMPPVDRAEPSPDAWPSLLSRLDQPPRWSLFDVGLAAAAAVALLLNPEWLWLLAYHL
jgi:hypothetical protein